MAHDADAQFRPAVHLDTERDAELVAYLSGLKSTQFRRDVAAQLATQGILTVAPNRIPQPIPDGRKKVLRLQLSEHHAELSEFIAASPRSFRPILLGEAMAVGFRRMRESEASADARDDAARQAPRRRTKSPSAEAASDALHPSLAASQAHLPLNEPADGGELDVHAMHREQRPVHLRLLDDLG